MKLNSMFVPCSHVIAGAVLFLLLAGATDASPPKGAAENLLTNPTFEGDPGAQGLPPGWSAERDEGIRFEARSGTADEPGRYLHVDMPSGKHLWLKSDPVPARPGGRYTLRFRVRAEGDGEPVVYLSHHSYTHKRRGAAHNGDQRKGDTDGQWVEHTITYEVEPTERANRRSHSWNWGTHMMVAIYSPTRHEGAFDIGDVSLTVEGGSEPLRGQHFAKPGDNDEVVDIGSRLELFVDDFLVDDLAGAAERRLHHVTPRNVVMELNKPWDGNIVSYLTAIQDDDRVLLYYSARPGGSKQKGSNQMAAVLESEDGVHFTRPNMGKVEFNGSTDNNLLKRGPGNLGHNFTPFIDTNPDAPADERFKAVARPGFSTYASPDGIEWRALTDGSAIGGPTDSQNVAFWDPNIEKYVAYLRAKLRDRLSQGGNVRDIRRSTSEDFINWTEPELIEYTDDRFTEMYTNGIRPYFRAPHIYIGTPARLVPYRKKLESHPHASVSDAMLMTSRDGKVFDRWEEGFIRPGTDPKVWTDRNNYPAWGMVQSAPDEISLYWTEHYRYPTMRIRRGTIRTDGFVSVRADGDDLGEMLTRPFTFTGNKLVVNYATSAVGMIRFELCDVHGNAIDGFELHNNMVFGNEIEHPVHWHNDRDLGELAGTPVRLRVQMHDADLYSIRFVE